MRPLLIGLLFLLAGSAQAQSALSLRAYDPQTMADVPPWPGPMPAQFVSEAAYEQTLQSHLVQLDLRAAGLKKLGKPPRTRHRLAGWMTVAAGGTLGGLALVATDEPPNDLAFRTWMGIGIAGALIVVTGFAILLSAPRNPHRREIRDLDRAGEAVKKELRRLKWERVPPQVYLSSHGVALTLKF